jgi:hypothetical protein
MSELNQDRHKLRMVYEETVRVDIEFLLANCEPCAEVPTTGVTLYHHKPMKYQGRFGSDYRG